MPTAVITGASSGIGEATVRKLISLNWNVIMISRTMKNMERVAKSCISNDRERKERISMISFDLTEPELVDSKLLPMIREYTNNGAIDLLVNNAGGNYHTGKSSVETTTLNVWNSTLNLNLTSPFLLIKGLRNDFIKSKYPASIINISSTLARYPNTNTLSYCVAKRGLQMLTTSYALYYGKYDIRVNTIECGYILTPAHTRIYGKDNINAVNDGVAAITPLGKIGQTKDIVNAILYLSDPDKGSFITGQNIVVDGGLALPLVHTPRPKAKI
eukprot:101120_1